MTFVTNIKRRFIFFANRMKILPLLSTSSSKNQSLSKDFIIFDTALHSGNLGDEIIMHYCNSILNQLDIHEKKHIPTHQPPQATDLPFLKENTMKIVAGTNIVSDRENRDYIWHKPAVRYLKNLCLMGVGLNDYSTEFSFYSRLFYRKLLAPSMLHSVRDSFTEKTLHAIGIKNVINTSCPTMWNLTSDFCRDIPRKKADSVVTTLTDYNKSKEFDFFLLDTLIKEYRNVFIWIQGDKDFSYLESYQNFSTLKIISHSLKAYDDFLRSTDCDYVGTRLHAGIHALNNKKRSIIIAVDDRAVKIANDTNLPVIRREEIKTKLTSFIERDFATEIRIPIDSIKKWKAQF